MRTLTMLLLIGCMTVVCHADTIVYETRTPGVVEAVGATAVGVVGGVWDLTTTLLCGRNRTVIINRPNYPIYPAQPYVPTPPPVAPMPMYQQPRIVPVVAPNQMMTPAYPYNPNPNYYNPTYYNPTVAPPGQLNYGQY